MEAYITQNDLQLLKSIKDLKDQKAFEELYHRYFTEIFRYVYKVMQDKDTAEDVVQNIFMDIWKRGPVIHQGSVKAYLFGCAKNQIAKEIRRNKWNNAQLAFLENLSVSRDVDDYMAEVETRSIIEKVVHQLPERCRNVFELSRYKYLSNKEIAQELGISVFTVENHIKKALYQIRQSLLLIFIPIICMGLLSCKESQEQEAYSFREETKYIDYSSEILTPLFSYFTLFTSEDDTLHLLVDENFNLVISDLNRMELRKVIPIKRGDGPEYINSSSVRLPIMLDSTTFLLEAYPAFYLINEEGFVIKRINIDRLLHRELEQLPVENPQNFWVIGGDKSYRSKALEGEYIFGIRRMDPLLGPDYPDFPQFAKVKIDGDLEVSLEVLPVFFPEEYAAKANRTYAYDENPRYFVDGDWLLYNYGFSSDVHFFHLETGETKSLSLDVKVGDNYTPAYDVPNRTVREALNQKVNTRFWNVFYDSRNKIIYRTHLALNHDESMESTYFINAYTAEGELLTEHRVASNSERLLRNAFLFEGKIYMNPFYPNSDERLELVGFQLDESTSLLNHIDR